MYIGQRVIAKVDGQLKELSVVNLSEDDIELSDGEKTIKRKYWEVRKTGNE